MNRYAIALLVGLQLGTVAVAIALAVRVSEQGDRLLKLQALVDEQATTLASRAQSAPDASVRCETARPLRRRTGTGPVARPSRPIDRPTDHPAARPPERMVERTEDAVTAPDSASLSSVWIVPHPPENKGRFLTFLSFRQQRAAGGAVSFVFREWTGKEYVDTTVSTAEVRWDAIRK